MDFNKRITSGILRVPDLMVLYGVEGVGKTTFASKAENPLFLDIEGGSKRVDAKRITDFKSILEIWEFLNWFHVTDHGYKTLVIDSLSEFERLAFQQTCLEEGCQNIEQVGGGFQKGYIVVLKQWELLKQAIKGIQAKKPINVILIGHANVKSFNDPTTNSAYDRYRLKLDERAASFLREWVDFIGFANYHVYTKGKENALKQKAYGDSKRRLYTERRPAWDAKNRLGLPLDMDFDYFAYSQAAHADPVTKAAAIITNIETLIKDIKNPELAQKMRDFTAKAGNNPTNLAIVQERIRARLDEQEKENGDGTTNAS